MKMGLSEAAVAAKRSKTTIFRNIKSGKLSAKMNEDGEYEIDPAELYRVYPQQKAVSDVTDETLQKNEVEQSETQDASASKAHMKQLEWFQDMLQQKEDQLAEQRQRFEEKLTKMEKQIDEKDRQLALPAPEKTKLESSFLWGLIKREKLA